MPSPTARQYYLAIDQGSLSSRAILFDPHYRIIHQASRPIETVRSPAGIEQDPDEIVSSTRQCIDEVVASLLNTLDGKLSELLIEASLISQRSTIICWDANSGAPLSPAISWQDTRDEQWLVNHRDSLQALIPVTGLRISPHYGANKMRWCLKNLTAVQKTNASGNLRYGPSVSYLLYRLTEENRFLVDPANASRTLLYNPVTGDWDSRLLDIFGLDAAKLPEAVNTRHDFGTLISHGIRIPLRLVNGDQSAALFAHGLPEPATLYLNAGTGAFLGMLKNGQALPEGLLYSIAYRDKHEELGFVEATVNGAASALHWAQAQLAITDITQLENFLDKQHNCYFINSIGGIGSPVWCSRLEPGFFHTGDEQPDHSARAKFAAVIESILFLIRWNIDCYRDNGFPIRIIRLSGGLSNSDIFCQLLANLSDIPVQRSDIREASACGSIYFLVGKPIASTDESEKIFKPTGTKSLHDPAHYPIGRRYPFWLEKMRHLIQQA